MLSDVRQSTIEPVITGAIAAGSLVHTDEYVVYARLPAWGYRHKTVCHGRGEYARDEDVSHPALVIHHQNVRHLAAKSMGRLQP